MSSNAPVKGLGFTDKLVNIWADIAYAQLRLIEMNRPNKRISG